VRVVITDDTPTFTWLGAGGDDAWSTAANWNALPPQRAKLMFAGEHRQASRNDFLESVGLVEIANGGFVLSGSPLVLLAGINSSGDNIWAIDSTLNSAQTLRSAAGSLRISGDLNNNGFDLAIDGQGDLLISGRVSGTGTLTKNGGGLVWLGGSNEFSGDLKIEQGRLALAGSSALGNSRRILISSGGTLDIAGSVAGFDLPSAVTLTGDGSVRGTLTVHGTLAPGDPIGALTFDEDLWLSGRTELEIRKLAGESDHDVVRVPGELVLGGELVVTSTGAPLAAGDAFRILEAGRVQGSFTGITLPPLPEGLQWHTGRLPTEGILAVTAVAPLIFPVSVGPSGGMVFEFNGISGVSYEVQTSDTLSGGGTWSTFGVYPGADGVTTLVLPIDSSRASQFYRLRVAP